LAEPYETDELTKGILWILKRQGQQQDIGHIARAVAVEKYEQPRVAAQYVNLYERIKNDRDEI
jgi:glycosyltransferase involved in cell wall biosynthesis